MRQNYVDKRGKIRMIVEQPNKNVLMGEISLNRFFKLKEHGTNVKTEIIAGLTALLRDGVHHFRQSQLPLGDGHGSHGSSAGGDLSVRGHRLLPDRLPGQRSLRAGAGHGPERLLYLLGLHGHGLHLAAGADHRAPVGHSVPDHCDLSDPRQDHFLDSRPAEGGHQRRHRPVHLLHRSAERRRRQAHRRHGGGRRGRRDGLLRHGRDHDQRPAARAHRPASSPAS